MIEKLGSVKIWLLQQQKYKVRLVKVNRKVRKIYRCVTIAKGVTEQRVGEGTREVIE